MEKKINKVKCDFEILEIDDDNGFVITKGNTVPKITVYDSELIENVINEKFNQKYRNLLYIIMNIANSDDATDSDSELVLVKIDELKRYIINKFGKILSKETLNKYLNMLLLLEYKVPLNVRRGKSR